MRFRATLQLHGKTATGISVPPDVVVSLGPGSRHPVVVTIGGHSYRSTVAARAGEFLIPVSAENRAAAGIAAGDQVEVELELDTAVREVAVPPDLETALAGDQAARLFFESLSYSQKRGYVSWVEDAKEPETRRARVDKALAQLAAGQAQH